MILRTLLYMTFILGLINVASAASWEENLKKGAATTKQNHLNVPFVKPDNWKTPYTTPGNWPIFENRGPIDRSPQDKPSKVLVMGTGDPTPSFECETV